MRNVDYPLHQFFSNVARGIFCETTMLDVSLIESMSEEDSRAVMREIKQKTDLLLAATYTAIKEAMCVFALSCATGAAVKKWKPMLSL